MTPNRPSFNDAGLALFAHDFDDPVGLDDVIVLDEDDASDAAAVSTPPPITPEMLEETCAVARMEGLRQGRAEVAAERDAERDAMTARLLAELSSASTDLRNAVDWAGARLAGLVLATLEAGFPALCARHGGVEVARFTREVVALLGQEPRIVIRIHPTLQNTIENVLAGLDPERREVILVEPREALPPGDARIAWRHGLASRDVGALRARLSEVLAPLGLGTDASDPVMADSLSTS